MNVTGRVFDCCSVLLDGKIFIECEFDQCTLIYTPGKFEDMVNCTLLDCDWACMDPDTGENISSISPLTYDEDEDW